MSQYRNAGKIDFGKQEYQELRPFNDSFVKVLYQARLSVRGKSFSGLMMIKKFPSDNYRLAFFSELGLNFFDFELRKSAENNQMQLYVNNIYELLDRSILINSFEKYFSMLLSPGLEEGTYKTFVAKDGSHVLILLNSYKGKDAYLSKTLIEPYEKVLSLNSLKRHPRIIISISEERMNNAPSHIVISQPGLHMQFELDQQPD